MSTLYKVDDPNLLTDLLSHGSGFHGPAVVLDGLTAEQALAKPHGLPHSIAEIVAHMCFWQDWFNGCASTGFSAPPEHAAEGWPAVTADGWSAKRIVAASDTLNHSLLPPGVPIPFLAKESLGSGILHATIHGGHHLGQIVTMRQLMGLWPPTAGSMTW
jgi:uncharacterized damage-inducible protein DinB